MSKFKIYWRGGFSNCVALKEIYIPASVTTISTSQFDASKNPFYGCSSDLFITCGATSKPSGWGSKWNYYSSSDQLQYSFTSAS